MHCGSHILWTFRGVVNYNEIDLLHLLIESPTDNGQQVALTPIPWVVIAIPTGYDRCLRWNMITEEENCNVCVIFKN